MMRVIADWHRHPQRPDNPRALELAKLGLDWLDTLLNRIYDAAKGFLFKQNIALFRLAADLALELNQPDQAYLILERSKSFRQIKMATICIFLILIRIPKTCQYV